MLSFLRGLFVIKMSHYILDYYRTTFLRKPRDLPLPFSDRLHAAFGSLSSLDRARSRTVRARSDQGAIRERAGAILE